MSKEIPKFIDLVANTPLIDLSSQLSGDNNNQLYAKCEFLNPNLSMKDRIASYIISKAEKDGLLKKGDSIVCASSGNTGCSVAMMGILHGYDVIIVTSAKCSKEKQDHIRAFGARLDIVEENKYMKHAKQLADEYGYFDINQYDNINNPEAYFYSLAPEIWQQTQGKVSHFIMTASTFGCITGTSRYLKQRNPEIKTILADPEHSCIEEYYQAYRKHEIPNPLPHPKYLIEGAGKSKPTACTDFSVIDEVINISDDEAITCCHQSAKDEGLLIGGSSGLNIAACKKIDQQVNNAVMVTILCDHGIKYLSKIYNPEFLKSQNIHV